MTIPTPKTPQNRTPASSTPPLKIKKIRKKVVRKKKLPTPPSRTQKNNSSGNISSFISLIIILGICFGLWTYKDTIINYLEQQGLREEQTQTVSQDTLFVGKEITVYGNLNIDKSTTHTHSLDTTEYGTLAIRSSVLDISDYNDKVSVQGTIVDYSDGKYILEATNIEEEKTAVQIEGKKVTGITYIAQASSIIGNIDDKGISLSQANDGSQTFTFTNNVDNNTLTARYFNCGDSSANNCEQFSSSYEESVGIDFVDSFGNIFYRLPDTNTWFVSLDNRIGLYLETTDVRMIPVAIKNMQFVTNQRVSQMFSDQIINNICQSSEYNIREPFSISLVSQDGEPAIQVTGKNSECLIAIDPNNSLGGTLLSVSEEEIQEETQEDILEENNDSTDEEETEKADPDTEENTQSSSQIEYSVDLENPSEEQIPLRPGKELTFSSKSAGYDFIFPTPNISYGSESVNRDTTIAGLTCTMATNIIGYKNRDNLSTDPTVTIYTCSNKSEPTLESNMLSIKKEDKTFIVQVNDRAWIDFAKNLIIE